MIKKEFQSYSKADWIEKTMADLKGKPFESLQWNTGEGFSMNPFYTKEDTKEAVQAFPNRTTHNYLDSWTIIQEFFEGNGKRINQNIIEGLESGTQGIIINGMATLENYVAVLQGVDLEIIEFYLKLNQRDKPNQVTTFLEYLDTVNVVKGNSKGNRIKGGLLFDPLNEVLFTGSWGAGKNEVMDEMKYIVAQTKQISDFHLISANGAIYGDAGASMVNELAYTLSLVHEYIVALSEGEKDVSKVISRISTKLSIGRSYLIEIAKVKVFRILLDNLLREYGITDHQMNIISSSSRFELNSIDEYSNLLRLTSQAMSAAIGGADGIVLDNYDGKEDAFGQRLSRNIQLMLLEESNFAKGVDVSAGSYSIENIIKELAEVSWIKFQAIEASGGWIEAVEKGMLQLDVHNDAVEKTSALMEKTRTSIGLNSFFDGEEKKWNVSSLQSDNDSPIRKLNKIVQEFE